MTRLLNVNAEPGAIGIAAGVIRRGGLVAFPTETVYGLGANALDAAAVARIFAAKQRALNDPLIVHIAPPPLPDRLAISRLVEQRLAGPLDAARQATAQRLADAFWPGPLTLVLPRGERIPHNLTAGRDTVALRMPSHPVAVALIRQSGVPIAAPSANRFGHVSPTTAQHVMADLAGRIDVVLDGGATLIGIESTVLDVTVDPPAILRPGGLPRERIEAEIGPTAGTERGEGEDGALASPGLLSRHYAPRARLQVARTPDELAAACRDLSASGLRVGLLVLDAQAGVCGDCVAIYQLGQDVDSVARNLYAGLRALDDDGADVILVSAVEAGGLGEAIADRLRRGSTAG